MEKKSTEILRDVEAALASLKERVQALEMQVEACRQAVAAEAEEEAEAEAAVAAAVEAEPAPAAAAPEVEPAPVPPVSEVDFDMEIGVDELPEEVPAPVGEILGDLPEEDSVDMVMEDLPEPVVAAGPAPAPAAVSEPVPEVKAAPAPVPAAKPETERLAWRLDKPGAPVKNIRSGISLYDRALFIGTLFKEDYALYDKTIGDLNGLSSLDEAVDYIVETFPDWNLKSDIVYSFMMAVRKKLG